MRRCWRRRCGVCCRFTGSGWRILHRIRFLFTVSYGPLFLVVFTRGKTMRALLRDPTHHRRPGRQGAGEHQLVALHLGVNTAAFEANWVILCLCSPAHSVCSWGEFGRRQGIAFGLRRSAFWCKWWRWAVSGVRAIWRGFAGYTVVKESMNAMDFCNETLCAAFALLYLVYGDGTAAASREICRRPTGSARLPVSLRCPLHYGLLQLPARDRLASI